MSDFYGIFIWAVGLRLLLARTH